jgi:hypothetical protein
VGGRKRKRVRNRLRDKTKHHKLLKKKNLEEEWGLCESKKGHMEKIVYE